MDVVVAVEVARLAEARAEAFELVRDHICEQLAVRDSRCSRLSSRQLSPPEHLGEAELALAHGAGTAVSVEGKREIQMQADGHVALARSDAARSLSRIRTIADAEETTALVEKLDDRVGRAPGLHRSRRH